MNIAFDTTVQNVTISLHVQDCPTCGVIYAISGELNRRRKEDGRSWYCPNGHTIHYTESEADRARKRAAEEELKRRRLEEQLANTELELRFTNLDLEGEKRSKAAIKGQLTKVKKRVGKGVCPCCNRTFQNLMKHMAGQHPDFDGEAIP